MFFFLFYTMWHLPGTWWWNAKRSLTCCHVCVKQGSVCLCLICVSATGSISMHGYIPYLPPFHLQTRGDAETCCPLCLSSYLFIHLFIDWSLFLLHILGFLSSVSVQKLIVVGVWCSQECATPFFFSATAARWGLPILSPSRELKAERRGWKKVASIWREALFDGTRPTCLPGRAAASVSFVS